MSDKNASSGGTGVGIEGKFLIAARSEYEEDRSQAEFVRFINAIERL